jgi:hypothetical protein
MLNFYCFIHVSSLHYHCHVSLPYFINGVTYILYNIKYEFLDIISQNCLWIIPRISINLAF